MVGMARRRRPKIQARSGVREEHANRKPAFAFRARFPDKGGFAAKVGADGASPSKSRLALPRRLRCRAPARFVPNGGMTFALLAPCSLRPSGHLRCASSAPPGASVVSSQASAAKRRLRVGKRWTTNGFLDRMNKINKIQLSDSHQKR